MSCVNKALEDSLLKKSKYLVKGIKSYIFLTQSSSQFLFNKEIPVHSVFLVGKILWKWKTFDSLDQIFWFFEKMLSRVCR